MKRKPRKERRGGENADRYRVKSCKFHRVSVNECRGESDASFPEHDRSFRKMDRPLDTLVTRRIRLGSLSSSIHISSSIVRFCLPSPLFSSVPACLVPLSLNRNWLVHEENGYEQRSLATRSRNGEGKKNVEGGGGARVEGSRARVQRTRPECMRTIRGKRIRAACKREIYSTAVRPWASPAKKRGEEAPCPRIKSDTFPHSGGYVSHKDNIPIDQTPQPIVL